MCDSVGAEIRAFAAIWDTKNISPTSIIVDAFFMQSILCSLLRE